MMERVFDFTSTKSEFSCTIFPAINLNPGSNFSIALHSIATYNSIPNIDEKGCNTLHFINREPVIIDSGTYELGAINDFLQEKLGKGKISLTANNNTFKCNIKCAYQIDFTKEASIARLIGFKERILEANVIHTSDYVVDIFPVNSINIEINIASGSIINGRQSHVIHTFYPTVPAGFKLVSIPTNLIYFPVTTDNIDNITIRIVDQQAQLISFRGEEITIRLHLKEEFNGC